MDGWEFTSKIVEAVAWPVTVGVIVVTFRSRVGDLIDNLTEFTLPGGVSGKVRPTLDDAEQVASGLNLEKPDEQQIETQNDPVELRANPSGVIMEAWKEIEIAGAGLLAADQSHVASFKNTHMDLRDALEELVVRGLVPPEEATLLKYLHSIRNRAAHGLLPRTTSEDAQRFVTLVNALKLTWLTRLAGAQPR